MIIYLDAVLLLNFTIDFLLLLGTNRICGYPFQLARCAVGAAIGAVHATVCMLPSLYFLKSFLWRSVFLCIISIASFGVSLSAIRRAIIFWIMNLALQGIALGLHIDGRTELICAVCSIFLLCLFNYGQTSGNVKFLPVELKFNGRNIRFIAMRDTGNTLHDPVTGKPVLIVDATVAQQLTGLSSKQLKDPIGVIESGEISGLRLIPYKTVGQSGGMLLGLCLPKVKVGNRIENTMVAFAPEKLSGDGTYQALTGGTI